MAGLKVRQQPKIILREVLPPIWHYEVRAVCSTYPLFAAFEIQDKVNQNNLIQI